MKILLDTHTFLWWSIEPNKLTKKLLKTLSSPSHSIYLSIASSWEAQIKIGLGKLILTEDLKTIIEREVINNGWEILPVLLHHTFKLESLPPYHKDPFDRLLIAQALSESLTLATKDPVILKYKSVKTIWD